MRFKTGDLVVLSEEELNFISQEHAERGLNELTDEDWRSLYRDVLYGYRLGVVVGFSGVRLWPIVQWMYGGDRHHEDPNKITLYCEETNYAYY
tara:strand:- start:352 stop:630 length:279 start_codon:yes stop_codon:yes gene_type:complete